MVLYVTVLKEVHDVKSFECGNPALAVWLKETARQHQKKKLSQTYVLVDDNDPTYIYGFYAVAIRAMTPIGTLPPEMARQLPRDIPGFTLGRLAVASDKQGQGYGADLLMNALERVAATSNMIGGYAFFVDAKDDKAANFYAKYGFIPLPSNRLQLFMPIADIPKD